MPAKRHQQDSSIGAPDIQLDVDVISGNSAMRGVLIATSRHSRGPRLRRPLTQPRLILVDDHHFAVFMLAREIDVTVDQVLKVYMLNEDFYGE